MDDNQNQFKPNYTRKKKIRTVQRDSLMPLMKKSSDIDDAELDLEIANI